MNKTEFIKELQGKLRGHLTFSQTELVLNTVLNGIARKVLSCEQLKLRGFGTFSIKHRRGRVIRHPQGGQFWAHESVTMKFKASPHLWRRKPYGISR